MPELTLAGLVLAIVIMAFGTAVQATLGFGLALVAAPLLHLINPMLVPGPIILCVWTLSLWVLWQERDALETSRLGSIVVGRLVGAVLATLVIGSISAESFDILFGILVLLAVMMSILHPHMVATPRAVFVATLASGFMGMLSGIGGPPLALVYQNAGINRLRAMLAMIFLVGASMSMALLAIVGKFGLQEVLIGLWLQLGVVGGIVLGQPLRRHLSRSPIRPLLLALCSIAALVILLRALIRLA